MEQGKKRTGRVRENRREGGREDDDPADDGEGELCKMLIDDQQLRSTDAETQLARHVLVRSAELQHPTAPPTIATPPQARARGRARAV